MKWLWALAVVLLANGLAGPCRAQEGSDPSSIRIGLVSSLFRDTSSAFFQVAMRPFRALLESQTGVQGALVGGGDAENLGRLLKEGRVHLGIFHGFEFAWARLKYPELKPLLIAVNGKPFLRAHLIVLAEGPVSSISDLRGQEVALPLNSREHCRLFMERRCVPSGHQPQHYYSEVVCPRNAASALAAVIRGEVKAAVVDELDLEAYQRRYPQRFPLLKSLQQSALFPSAVIAYVPGALSDSLLQRFRTGMLASHRSEQGREMLDLCGISRFAEVPAGFEQMLADIARGYPPAHK